MEIENERYVHCKLLQIIASKIKEQKRKKFSRFWVGLKDLLSSPSAPFCLLPAYLISIWPLFKTWSYKHTSDPVLTFECCIDGWVHFLLSFSLQLWWNCVLLFHIWKKTPRHLVCIVFWSDMEPNWPNMPIFCQKSQFWAKFGRLRAKNPNFYGSK